jgi:chromosome segregation ATPase
MRQAMASGENILDEGSEALENLESQLMSAQDAAAKHQRIAEDSAAELRFLRAQAADEKAARQAAEDQVRRAQDELQKVKAELLAAKDDLAGARREHEAALDARFKEISGLMKALQKAQDRDAHVADLVSHANRFQLLFTRLLNALLKQSAPRFLPKNVRVQRKCALMEKHSLFEPAWYLEQNPDVAQAGVDPAEHFVNHGLREGRAVNRTMEDLRRSMAALEDQKHA